MSQHPVERKRVPNSRWCEAGFLLQLAYKTPLGVSYMACHFQERSSKDNDKRSSQIQTKRWSQVGFDKKKPQTSTKLFFERRIG
jgi:hypothetical protein